MTRVRGSDIGYMNRRGPATYVYGIRPSDGVRCAEELSSGEVAAFQLEHPEVQTTPTITRHLCFIYGFAPR